VCDPGQIRWLPRPVRFDARSALVLFGSTVFSYLTGQRLELAMQMLNDTDQTAAQVAFALGYKTPQHFGEAFKRRFGITPKAVRKNP
jgi:AraC family transcriptional activator of pyochelin receptor